MRALRALTAIGISFCLAGIVYAESRDDHDHDRDDRDGESNVVTDAPPSTTATMTLRNDGDCPFWTVRGQVRKPFRGPGAKVKLLCTPFSDLSGGDQQGSQVFPDDECVEGHCGDVDGRGNYTFDVHPRNCQRQLSAEFFCVFVVNLPARVTSPSKPPGGDPNGSAPCNGDFCPDSI